MISSFLEANKRTKSVTGVVDATKLPGMKTKSFVSIQAISDEIFLSWSSNQSVCRDEHYQTLQKTKDSFKMAKKIPEAYFLDDTEILTTDTEMERII